MTKNIEQFKKEKIGKYKEKFPCNHHPAQCNGYCEEEKISFLSQTITETAELMMKETRVEKYTISAEIVRGLEKHPAQLRIKDEFRKEQMQWVYMKKRRTRKGLLCIQTV